jgi:sarcosine oxidase gamma subunit
VDVQPATTERRNQRTLITHEVYRNASPTNCDVSKLVVGIKITGGLAYKTLRHVCSLDVDFAVSTQQASKQEQATVPA